MIYDLRIKDENEIRSQIVKRRKETSGFGDSDEEVKKPKMKSKKQKVNN